jgi:16S rRNA (guanine527-N7)-methyltransferase
MEQEIYKKYPFINRLNVSRETFSDLDNFVSMVVKKNKDINIISRKISTKKVIMERHVIDSVQAIDFIDLNSNTTSDIGSGAGFPGIVMAIITKSLKKKMKYNLYEKSYHKTLFLREVSRELKLDTEVIQSDIFKSKKLNSGTIMSRAFKPLPTVLDLVNKNFSSYKNLVIFMGRNGQKTLGETLESWDFDFVKKKSITSKDSFLLNIKNIKKK